MLCTLSYFYSAHLLFVVFIVEVIDGSPLDLLSCPHLQPPLYPLCLYACLLFVLVTPPWTTLDPENQRDMKVCVRSVSVLMVYWYPKTKISHQYQCISAWPCAVLSASISSAWVDHLWISLLQTLPSQHSEKQQCYIYRYIYIHTHTHFPSIFFLPWLYRLGHAVVCHCRFPWGWWDRTVPCWGMSLCHH